MNFIVKDEGIASQSASASRKGGGGGRSERKSKMFGREPRSKGGRPNERENKRSVKEMPFTDQFGDCGVYSGLINEAGRPEGKGSMKYENGVFYEGTWTDGCQDQAAASQYERIRGGFTSWSGKGKNATKSGMVLPWNARKNDMHDTTDKTNVRGMEWIDLNGDSGRYSGEVNTDRLPHGRGIMKYDFGLIAEGDWVNGVLKEGPQDRMIGASAGPGGMSVGPGMSIGPGGMSIGPGGMSMGPGGMSIGPGMSAGPMSVGLSVGGPGSTMLPMGPMQMMHPGMQVMHPPPMNPMMRGQMNAASQHVMISQQNAMMRNMHSTGSSVYGAGPMPMGGPMPPHMQMHMPPPMQMMHPHPQNGPPTSEKPPISEIKIDSNVQ